MRFNDLKHVENYKNNGEYPKIHNDIYAMSKYVTAKNVIDLGCCTGLLASRLREKHQKIIGIEPNDNYLMHAIKEEGIKYYKLKVEKETLSTIGELIRNEGVTAVYARRVLPEILESGGSELVRELVKVFFSNGVQFIVLEGRKATKRAVNPLKSIEREVEACSKYYDVIHTFNDCAVLRSKYYGN